MRKRKILLYGSGNAREHATLCALRHKNEEVDVCSLITQENALMQQEEGVKLIDGLQAAFNIAEDYKPDNIFILSLDELIAGEPDAFRQAGYNVFGVSKQVTQLENSKSYAKDFMRRHNIPTPDYYVVHDLETAECYLRKNWDKTKRGYVIKTDLSLSNAYDCTEVPDTLDEALIAVKRLYKQSNNCKLIIEEFISGYELSLHILVDRDKYYVMPPVQDYKKLFPQNEGPMTHGVAAVAMSMPYPQALYKNLCSQVIEPTLQGLLRDGFDYQSILYIGLMIDKDQPQVLEYNIRSGNPEWISLMGLLNTSLINLVDDWSGQDIWKDEYFSVTSYAIASGYPQTIRSQYNEQISYIDHVNTVNIFGESIVSRDGNLYPNGGRVFALRQTGSDFDTIKQDIVGAYNTVQMNGLYYRDDIYPINFS